MMRSMFSGVSGLRIHQTKMDVIANNISNVNTTGFKSSRVTFAEIFAQTLSGASRANDATGRGGVNPMQIGLGGSVASIDLSMTQGAAQRTDNPFDIMIQGSGFFIVGDNSGTYFTRAGVFNLDREGNLVNPSGFKLQGWRMVGPTGLQLDKDDIDKFAKPIQIDASMQYASPQETTSIVFEDNISPSDTKITTTMAFYDSLGNRFTATVTFTGLPTTTGALTTWNYTIEPTISMDGVGSFDLATAPTGGQIIFNTSGKIDVSSPTNSLVITIPIGQPIIMADGTTTYTYPASNLNTATTIELDFSNVTFFNTGNASNLKSYNRDGYEGGELISLSIGSDGIITGLYANSQTKQLWQVPVARFKNPAGLEKFGDNLYIQTSNSGEFNGIGEEVQLGGGKMMAGVLEMSNVDLAQEFTEMITTQRGFQANSRIISVSDEMLQELVRLR